MFMTRENLTLLLSAIAIVEGTLQLLITVIGVLAAVVVVAFVLGALTGVFITCLTWMAPGSPTSGDGASAAASHSRVALPGAP